MARPLRLEHPGAVWHITSRGNNRGDIFLSDGDRLTFLALLAEAVRRFGWIIHAYVLMTNHFHLVMETPEMTLSRGMKWLNSKYAQWFNRTHDRCGHLFQGRFKGFLVEKETYLLELMRYVVLNPVRARMVEHPEEYRWSSYRATAGFESAPAWLATSWTLAPFGPDLSTQQANYRTFVGEGLFVERSPLDDLVGQLFLGSASWIDRMKALVESKPRSSEHPFEQRYVGRPTIATIVETVAEVFGDTPEDIRMRRGGTERSVVAWLGCYEGFARLGALAAALRLRSTSRVSVMIGECDRRLDRDPLLRIAIDRCTDLLRHGRHPVAAVHRPQYPSLGLHA